MILAADVGDAAITVGPVAVRILPNALREIADRLVILLFLEPCFAAIFPCPRIVRVQLYGLGIVFDGDVKLALELPGGGSLSVSVGVARIIFYFGSVMLDGPVNR